MPCDKAAQIHAYHDGELSPEQRSAVEAHLNECPACGELLADLRRVSAVIASAPMENISPIAMARLQRSFHVARDRGVLRVASWLTATAAAVLLGMLFVWSESTSNVTTVVSSGASWQTVAVMPPADGLDEPIPDLVLAAQWMANDLSPGEMSIGERQ